MTAPMLLIAVGAGLSAALLALSAARMLMAPWQHVPGRLATIATDHAYERPTAVELMRDRRTSGIRLLDRLVRGGQWSEATHDRLERAGVLLRVGEYLAIRVISATLGLLLTVALVRGFVPPLFVWVLAPLGLLVGAFLPALYLRRRIARREAAMEAQLVELSDVMASMLQSGFGYMQALTATAEQLGPPLSHELTRMVDAVRLGGDTTEELMALKRRVNSPDFGIMATAIEIQRRSGGNLADILRGVAATIRERQSLKREIHALTSRERFSAMFIAAFPFLLAGGLTLLLPDTFGLLFIDPWGRIILGVAIAMDLVGYLLIKRVTNVDV